ncbi:TlpA family protein disulfide reductase [Pedobacter insulae]|uniref:Thiol-disulfide isomerase or thioredoxin n=1 Tax=Pedobacter insulae TaxID=414048 RepID=A0A1I2VUJ0_9SPHI|nr:TlpA disulfide reductase family protein [Pedobacter insulae]SFG92089.1 Thiol-disulfide isomerase or thioredoxin [Pedobacter insulae]
MKLKHYYFALLISFFTFSALAQQPVEITGTLVKKRIIPVKLFKVHEGKAVELASTAPTTNGKFGFIFYPEYEGLYVLGTGTVGSPNDNYKFYFKGGEKLAVNLLDSSYVLTGKLNSKENIVLTQWHDLVFPLEMKAVNFMKVQSTFVDYFPLQEEIVAKAKTFLNGKATGNTKFDANMRKYIAWDLASYATNFINTPRSAHPAVEEYSPFYATLKAEDFAKNTTDVYANPWGNRTLSGLMSLNLRQGGFKFEPGLAGLKNNLAFVPNDTLKGDLVLDNAARYKTYADYKTLMDAYGKYVITAGQKKRSLDILTPLLTLKTGENALAFSYPDKDGKTVTMASLKGKVVLVDVWATWCGPCKVEIPHLKKLEEEMKGKDVAIISLSTDAVTDKEKWLKMIKDENLGGIQLFAGGPGNEFSQYYKVNTIPRFLVFDKQGKIVTVDSPRPSNPELKALLEKELAK